ncbi:hypothetical protein [Zavarzinella formosa]|uniref:hypothetical protein n=1 Tax=Zavarzinella formosa TaxID=360055 RepID=UPI00030B8E2D|nr:hypothetical protein [Zavarzinella formosa]
MVRYPLAVLTALLLAGLAAADPATVLFTKSPLTGKHIVVQSAGEQRRIYFPLEIKNAAGQMAFARIRCKPEAGEETLQTVTFKITGNSEIWRVCLHAPQFSNKTATYQIETGLIDNDQLDTQPVTNSFAWQARWAGGQQVLGTTMTNALGQDVRVSIPLVVRLPIIQGGMVKFAVKMTVPQSAPVTFGAYDGPDADTLVPGSGVEIVR